MSRWREFWTPEEYAEMCRLCSPEQLEHEMARMGAKREHYWVAETFSLSVEEAALVRVRSLMVLGESGGAA